MKRDENGFLVLRPSVTDYLADVLFYSVLLLYRSVVLSALSFFLLFLYPAFSPIRLGCFLGCCYNIQGTTGDDCIHCLMLILVIVAVLACSCFSWRGNPRSLLFPEIVRELPTVCRRQH